MRYLIKIIETISILKVKTEVILAMDFSYSSTNRWCLTLIVSILPLSSQFFVKQKNESDARKTGNISTEKKNVPQRKVAWFQNLTFDRRLRNWSHEGDSCRRCGRLVGRSSFQRAFEEMQLSDWPRFKSQPRDKVVGKNPSWAIYGWTWK